MYALHADLREPLAMIAILSPKMSASSIEWVVMMVTRLRFMRRIRFQISLLMRGSIPVVGSSAEAGTVMRKQMEVRGVKGVKEQNIYCIYKASFINSVLHHNLPRKTIIGSPRNVRATLSLLFIPPLNVFTW